MPCFIPTLNRLNIKVVGADLILNHKRIDELMRVRLGVTTHEELHVAIEELAVRDREALEKMLKEVLEQIAKENKELAEKNEERPYPFIEKPPDRLDAIRQRQRKKEVVDVNAF